MAGSDDTTEALDSTANPPWRLRPVLVRAGGGPVFVGGGADTFACSSCREVLAADVPLQQIAAVSIECAKCGAVSQTPSWPDGLPLPMVGVVSLGRVGRLPVSQPIAARAGVVITWDEEIDRARRFASIGRSKPEAWALGADELAAVEVELLLKLPGFADALAKTRRAQRVGNDRFLAYPLAWALARLQARLTGSSEALSDDDWAAAAFLGVARYVLTRMHDHPLLPSLASELVTDFFHAQALFVTACHLADAGNSIGFGVPKPPHKSPDLFVSVTAAWRVGIEAKAPESLRWPSPLPSADKVLRDLKKALQRARDQVPVTGGIVVLGCSLVSPEVDRLVGSVWQRLVERRDVSSRIAAVAFVTLPPKLELADIVGPVERWSTFFQVEVHRNPHYSGRPIDIATSRSGVSAMVAPSRPRVL